MRRSIAHQLSRLPYRDMRGLVQQITESVPCEEESLCVALSGLRQDGWDDLEDQRQELLAEFFRRKKQITVQPQGNGWSIQVPTAGLEIRCDNIEEGMHEMLQTLISFIALD
jgi:hypothetical protein